jgi:hypothetical protein
LENIGLDEVKNADNDQSQAQVHRESPPRLTLPRCSVLSYLFAGSYGGRLLLAQTG